MNSKLDVADVEIYSNPRSLLTLRSINGKPGFRIRTRDLASAAPFYRRLLHIKPGGEGSVTLYSGFALQWRVTQHGPEYRSAPSKLTLHLLFSKVKLFECFLFGVPLTDSFPVDL